MPSAACAIARPCSRLVAALLCSALCAPVTASDFAVVSAIPGWESRSDTSAWSTRMQTCGTLQSSPPGSDALTDCECAPGLTWSATACSVCAAGTYKTDTGSHACTACGTHATSLPGASTPLECLCEPGYTPEGTQCVQCGTGTYKPHNGNSSCVPCPAASTSPTASTAFAACTCNAGFRSYAGSCELCPANVFSTGGDSITTTSACTECPAASSSAAGSGAITNCTCNAGYVRESDACNACDAGKYQERTEAVSRYYLTCVDCPVNSDSPSASASVTACICNAGYTGADGTACSACAAGTYKDTAGSTECLPCPSATFKATAGPGTCTECALVLPNSLSGTGSGTGAQNCQCNAGYTLVDGACNLCSNTTFKNVPGNGTCSGCGFNAVASDSRMSCKCVAGATVSVGSCRLCEQGKYKSSTGSAPCTSCNAGKFSTSIGGTSSSVCTDCAINTFQTSAGQAACTPCPPNATLDTVGSESNACVCAAGLIPAVYPVGAGGVAACIICPVNHFCVGNMKTACTANATAPEQSQTASDCVCNGGYYTSSAAIVDGMPTCQPCTADHYCTGGTKHECPQDSTAETRSDSVADCVCNPGFREQ